MIIAPNRYSGLSTGTGKPNKTTALLYRAKFLIDEEAVKELAKLAVKQTAKKKFDLVVPVKPRTSKISLSHKIAKAVAKEAKVAFLDALQNGNKKTTDNQALKDANILVIDDAIYTGKTMNSAIKALKDAGAKSVTGYAIVTSKSFSKK